MIGLDMGMMLASRPSGGGGVVDVLESASAYWVPNQSDGQTMYEQVGNGAPDFQNGSTATVDTNDCEWLQYVEADGGYAWFPGTAGNFLTIGPASCAGTLKVEAKIQYDSFGSIGTIASQRETSNEFSFRINSDKRLTFLRWNSVGSLVINQNSNATLPFNDGDVFWCRAINNPDNGSGSYELDFETSADGVTWTALGAQITGSSFVPNSGNSTGLVVGFRNSVNPYEPFVGKIFALDVFCDGFRLSSWDGSFSGQTGYTDPVSGEDWTVNRSATGLSTHIINASIGGGFAGDGISRYLQSADNAIFGVGDGLEYSLVQRWVLPEAATSFGSLYGTTSGTDGVIIRTDGTNPKYQGQVNNNATTVSLNDGVGNRNDVVTTVTLTMDATNLRLYVDGVLVDTQTRTAGAIPSGAARLFAWGGATPSGYQSGLFLGAAIFDRALTPTEIERVEAELKGRNQ